MKSWLLDISVETTPTGDPQRVTLRTRQRRVLRVLDRYRYGGRWWRGEHERHYFLLELEGELVAEVYVTEGRWVLARTAD